MTLENAARVTGTVVFRAYEPNRILSMQDLINAGIEIDGIGGLDPAHVYVQADTAIQEQVWNRLARQGKALPPSRILASDVVMTQHQDATCPCSYPEGWDACPVHRDGLPTQPTTTGTEERRPDPRTTEQRNQ